MSIDAGWVNDIFLMLAIWVGLRFGHVRIPSLPNKAGEGCPYSNSQWKNKCEPMFAEISKNQKDMLDRLNTGNGIFNKHDNGIETLKESLARLDGQIEGFLKATKRTEKLPEDIRKEVDNQFKTIKEYFSDLLIAEEQGRKQERKRSDKI